MKLLGISQRVDNVPHYNERRDCLDQKWAEFAALLGCQIVPLPNIKMADVTSLLARLKLDAILLSGGNTLTALEPAAKDTAPERDAFEGKLINYALQHNLPLIGICRGMQMINSHLGGHLVELEGHVAVDHSLINHNVSFELPKKVNSYHSWGIPPQGLADSLEGIATDTEGFIEAFSHISKPILGIMWHPEREQPFSTLDIQFIKEIL